MKLPGREWFLDLMNQRGYAQRVPSAVIQGFFQRFRISSRSALGIGVAVLLQAASIGIAADEAVTLEDDLARDPAPATEAGPEPPPDLPPLDAIPTEAFVEPSIPVPTPAPATPLPQAAPLAPPPIQPPRPPQIPMIEQEADAQFFPGSDDTDLTGELDTPPPPSTDPPNRFSEFFLGALDLVGPGDPGSRDRLSLTVGPSIGYDNNVFYSNTDQVGSATAGASATLNYNIGTPRFSMVGQTSVGVTYYENRPGNPQDLNTALLLNAVYQPNRRIRLAFSTSNAYLSRPDPQIIGGSSRFSGDYYTTNTSLEATYSVTPRWTIRTSYRFFGIYYTEEAINFNQGLYQQTFTLALEYLLTPVTTVFIEYRYNPVLYYEADLGSTGQIITLGFIHTFSPRSTWNFQAGVENRELTQPAFDGPSGYAGPFLETEYEYQFADSTSLQFSGRFGNEPSGVSGLTIRTTLRGSLAINHDFTSRLTGDLGIIYTLSNFEQPGPVSEYDQTEFSAFLGLRFRFNPALALLGRINYASLESDFETQNYERTVTTLGLEVIF